MAGESKQNFETSTCAEGYRELKDRKEFEKSRFGPHNVTASKRPVMRA